ncbi:MAG: DUF1203 domain-containing protein [Rhodanobacteraceae bacterium]|nr:DUF1203 domain-containing protein [Rhodanobacteraceae bacterium]
MSNFRLIGLDPQPFAALFDLDDAALRARGVRRRIADADHGYPCRISLADAAAGEELLLLSHEHLAEDSPYRASGPIYIRRHARPRTLAVGEVPPYVSARQISLRGYSARHLMVDAEVCEGSEVATRIQRMFADARIAYIHLHNARPGCYSCRAERA